MLHTETNVIKIKNKNVQGDAEFSIYKIKFTAINSNPMLCGRLVVRVSGYRSKGPGVDSRPYQIF
jgi:hypothetical protein